MDKVGVEYRETHLSVFNNILQQYYKSVLGISGLLNRRRHSSASVLLQKHLLFSTEKAKFARKLSIKMIQQKRHNLKKIYK